MDKHNELQAVLTNKKKVNEMMCSEKPYIIDGDYFFNLEKRLEHADLVIWIKIPLLVCVANIIKRRFKYAMNTRPDITEGCDEKLSLSFLMYALRYNKRSGKQRRNCWIMCTKKNCL